jgi:plastocyanin
MKMKRFIVGVAVSALLGSAVAASTPGRATSAPTASRASVVIKHVYFGCHVWSVNDSRASVESRLTIRPGTTVTVANLDNHRHTLVQVSGPTAAWIGDAATATETAGLLVPYGSSVDVRLAMPGTYVFTTVRESHGLTLTERAGDAALVPGNDLVLTVKVLPTID